MLKTKSVKMMGTTIDVTLPTSTCEEIYEIVWQQLRLYNHKFSANDASSQLCEINENAGIRSVKVDDELFHLVKLGLQHSMCDASNLNIAIGPLIQLWRIGFSDARVPTQDDIQARLAIVNPADIALNEVESTIFLTKKGMKIDLGAIAKGYIADKIVALLKQYGIEYGLINLGGNVLTFGNHPINQEGYWRIGIQDPQKPHGHHVAVIPIKNKTIVTSGIYERTLNIGDTQYHHIFDSRTGYPIETELASITVICDRSVDAEIWTTRLFGMSQSDMQLILADHPDIKVVCIYQNGHITSIG